MLLKGDDHTARPLSGVLVESALDIKLLAYIRCPGCGSELVPATSRLGCTRCGKRYEVVNGIPVLVELERLDPHLRGQVGYFQKESRFRGGLEPEPWQRSYLGRFTGSFHPRRGDLVVDCGTGSGYMAVGLSRLGCECVACDLDLSGLLRLRSELVQAGLESRVHLVCCNAQELPLRSGIARYLVLNAVLEHLPEPRKAIIDVQRVCAVESGLMVAVPLAYRYLNPVFIPVNFIHDRRIGHLRRYDEEGLSAAFAGWELEKTYYTGHFGKVAKTLLNMLVTRFPEHEIEAADRLKESKRWGASNIVCVFSRR